MARNAMPCLLLSLLSAAGLRAEEPPEALATGVRARVTVPHISPKPLVGTIRKLTDDAIELTTEGREDSLALPRDSIVRLEVRLLLINVQAYLPNFSRQESYRFGILAAEAMFD